MRQAGDTSKNIVEGIIQLTWFILENLEEFKSENTEAYRKKLNQLEKEYNSSN